MNRYRTIAEEMLTKALSDAANQHTTDVMNEIAPGQMRSAEETGEVTVNAEALVRAVHKTFLTGADWSLQRADEIGRWLREASR